MWHHELLRLDAQTTLEAAIGDDRAYRLALWRDGECLVEFHGERGVHRRRSGERSTRHEFRSIEQLRYDFEQEIAGLVGRR
jgi:hypothetical protein